MEREGRGDRPSPGIAGRTVQALQRMSCSRFRAFALYAMVSLAFTWPLAFNLASHIPAGSESSPTVPLFNLWVLGWNATWLSQPGAEYWDAPIFHPVPGSFSFSDPQPLTGLLAAPAWNLAPALAYNLILLLFLTLNGLAVRSFLLARGVGAIPSLLAGILAQALPFLTHERGVLQLQPIFAMVWAIDQFWKIAHSPRWVNGIGFGLAAAATFLTSAYYALFLLFCLLPFLAALLRSFSRPSAWGALLAGIALGALLTLPIAISQARKLDQMGFGRAAPTIERFSASAADYLRRSPALLLPAPSVLGRGSAGGNYLWPGFLLTGLAAWGAFQGLGKPATRRLASCFLAAGCLTLLLSFGLHLSLGGWQPYDAIRWLIPGMENLRSPFRFAVCVQVFLVFLGAIALDSLLVRKRPALALLLVALALLELAPRPARLIGIPSLPATSPLLSPAAFIPFAQGDKSRDYFDTVAAMCLLLPSGVRLLNGYSGYFPQLNRQLKQALADFPTEEGISVLQALGVRSLLVKAEALDVAQRQRLERAISSRQLESKDAFAGLAVFTLNQARLQPVGEYKGSWKMRVALQSKEIEFRLSPAELGAGYYVLSPRSAPLAWEVRLRSPSGVEQAFLWRPPGAQLVHRDAAGLLLKAPRPGEAGEYLIEFRERGSRSLLAKAAFRLPPSSAGEEP